MVSAAMLRPFEEQNALRAARCLLVRCFTGRSRCGIHGSGPRGSCLRYDSRDARVTPCLPAVLATARRSESLFFVPDVIEALIAVRSCSDIFERETRSLSSSVPACTKQSRHASMRALVAPWTSRLTFLSDHPATSVSISAVHLRATRWLRSADIDLPTPPQVPFLFADGIIEAVVSADERGAGEREEDRDVAKPTLSSLCDVSSRRAPAGTGAHRRGFLEPWYQSFAEYVPLTPCKHAHRCPRLLGLYFAFEYSMRKFFSHGGSTSL